MYGSRKPERDLPMSSDAFTIQVHSLSKVYNIYSKPIDRLKQSLVPRLLRLVGKTPRIYYKEFWALHDVSLDVKKGETVGIIGRNGSGKSTLLQMICGTLTPTSGEVETRGRIAALLELGSGFNPEFTGRENVFLNGAILGLSQDEIAQRFDAIAAFADIGEFIEQPVKFYSSGMMVRLAFAVQAMVDPDILIVDEALAVGDEKFQRKCFRRLEKLKEKGTSILLVSHSAQQIIELCDRALLLDQGQRLLLANPLTVVRAYQKMLFANSDDQVRLVQEFKELDRNNVAITSDSFSTYPVEHTIPESGMDGNGSDIDYYESGLIPKSTEIYPMQGARIDSIKIYNVKGLEVNNLLTEQEYKFEILGTFLEDRQSVYIGFGIRTMNGINITGHAYPAYGKYIHNVKSGQKYRLVHTLRMNLTPGTYFVNLGNWSTIEPVCLHRISDASMFRVLPKSENRTFGYVDLSVNEPEFEILDEKL